MPLSCAIKNASGPCKHDQSSARGCNEPNASAFGISPPPAER